MTNWDEFLAIQNGRNPTRSQTVVPNALRYMITGWCFSLFFFSSFVSDFSKRSRSFSLGAH
jgi:hypothetical protein